MTLYEQAAQEFGPALHRLTFAYEVDADRRMDLLQEIHLALWRSLERFDNRCSLRTWVYRVAHNTAISHVIRRKPPSFLTLEQAEAAWEAPAFEAAVERQQALHRLFGLIHQLEPVSRQTLLAYLEGMEAADIADITGQSVNSVWTRIHRLKKLLARQFQEGVSHAH